MCNILNLPFECVAQRAEPFFRYFSTINNICNETYAIILNINFNLTSKNSFNILQNGIFGVMSHAVAFDTHTVISI